VARIEIEHSILAPGLQADKVKSLQLDPVQVSENGSSMVLEGPSIIVARAWVVDPEAWKAIAGTVKQGKVALLDATQLKVSDSGTQAQPSAPA
jgi:hypothetical protein